MYMNAKRTFGSVNHYPCLIFSIVLEAGIHRGLKVIQEVAETLGFTIIPPW